ncbi:hypothetical protein N7532_000059 [Penicillium argentinense]|uniref:Ricin B lectin domain-containing protein n=1 Tax=Penicillium argentinense TaxID=1131581 RepID=A0A9W9G4G5_9EURO|nr:uncharacterized protein N7532_000059 [Penicillium argentinense]KAJ5112014.1 hypothetical protein N7532_000059 [Penicillium argentinense]
MKTVLTLGALAAIFQSAFALQGGSYTIGSADLASNQVLSDLGQANDPLVFSDKNNHPYQTWFFTARGSQRDFVIQNLSGGYINCVEPGSPCVSGDEEEIYTVEQVTDNGYELVAKKTGYFLRADGQYLQLAEYNNKPDEEFILTPTQ